MTGSVPRTATGVRGCAAPLRDMFTPSPRLRGSRFVRTSPTRRALPRAAAILVDGRGLPSGYSTAEFMGASCGPSDAPLRLGPP